ncbi:DUF4870 family protein [Amorphus coralli]|uniref:DUF4870 family protein n=1 Tax=Amorphus coralli TaxID=340680 RepID=UPI00037E1F5C|nr:hypothetical protein [Amorphus coralli]
MSESNPTPVQSQDDAGLFNTGRSNIQLIYALYLVSFITGLTAIVGIIFAHLNREKATGWAESHYVYAIRTFWIGLLYGVISFVLSFVLIGFVTGVLAVIWFAVRCIKGLIAAGNREPIAKPETWLI